MDGGGVREMNDSSTLAAVMKEGRTVLTEVEAKSFLEAAGLPIVRTVQARSIEESLGLSREMGFPVAMKILSPDIIHKSDCGGVRLNLQGGADVEKAYEEIMGNARRQYPHARVHGVSVQAMAPPGQEVIIGMSKDDQFGPLLMFGIGGIMVELLKDVSFRIVPLSRRDAREMVAETKGYRLLTGFRGAESVDIVFLENLLTKASDLIEGHPEIKELDINPVVLYKDGALVVDARVILEDEA
jgi:acetate---CoA ligase (ADP-forming) subunit beta